MPLAVVDRIEAWRPASAGAKLPAVARLVGLVRDGAADPETTQVGPVPVGGGVRLVGADSIWSDAGPARPETRHADSLQYGFELRRVPALPRCDHDRHGLLALLDRQVQLGGEPAARLSQPMITRLGEDAARRLFLQVTLLAGPSRMLMSTAHRGIDAQIPRDRPLRVGQGLELGEDPVPGAAPLPPAEQVVDPAPRPVLDRHVSPRNTGTDPEPYAVDQLPPRLGRFLPIIGSLV